MTTVTQVKLTCDVCGSTNDVKTRTFGLDGKAYEIDLCRRDGNALGRVAARYIAKARKVTAKRRRRQRGGRPRQGAKTSRSGQRAAKVSGVKARAAGSRRAAKASGSQGQNAEGSSAAAAGATGVTTNNGDVDLVSPPGPITLTNAVNATPTGGGASTATVRLNSGGAVTQTPTRGETCTTSRSRRARSTRR